MQQVLNVNHMGRTPKTRIILQAPPNFYKILRVPKKKLKIHSLILNNKIITSEFLKMSFQNI